MSSKTEKKGGFRDGAGGSQEEKIILSKKNMANYLTQQNHHFLKFKKNERIKLEIAQKKNKKRWMALQFFTMKRCSKKGTQKNKKQKTNKQTPTDIKKRELFQKNRYEKSTKKHTKKKWIPFTPLLTFYFSNSFFYVTS